MARGWKLMDDQKAAIEAVHDAGVPYTALAVQYGVSVATILRVCRQDTYERQKAANRRYQAANIKKITETRREHTRITGCRSMQTVIWKSLNA